MRYPTAKFQIPKSACERPTRQIPTRLLNAKTQIVLLEAPVGYDKRACLAQLASACTKSIWLSIDKQDNDVIDRHDNQEFVFWSALAQSLGAHSASSPSSHNLTNDALHTPNVLLQCLDSLCEESDPPILFWQNFERLFRKELLAELHYFLDYLPRKVRVFIASDTSTPISSQERQRRGQLTRITTEDLKMSDVAIKSELIHHGHRYHRDTVSALKHISDAWPAFITLFAEQDSQSDYSTQLHRAQTQWSAYIHEISSTRLSDAHRQWLALLAHVKFLSAPLGEHIAQHFDLKLNIDSDSEHYSSNLEPTSQVMWSPLVNHFLITNEVGSPPIGNASTPVGALKMQPAIRLAFQQTLAKASPLFLELQQLCAEWHRKEEAWEHELAYRLELKDWSVITERLALLGPSWFKSGSTPTLKHYLDKIPEAVLWRSPDLLIQKTWLLKDVEKYAVGKSLLNRAESLLLEGGRTLASEEMQKVHLQKVQQLRSEIASLRSTIVRLDYNNESLQAHSRSALELSQNSSTPLRYRAYLSLGADDYFHGRFHSASEHLEKAIEYAKLERASVSITKSLGYLVESLFHCGKIKKAQSWLKQGLQGLRLAQFNQSPHAPMQHFAGLILQLEMGEIAAVRQAFQKLLHYRRQSHCDQLEHLVILLRWFHFCLSQNELDQADQALAEIGALNQEVNFRWPFALGTLPVLQNLLEAKRLSSEQKEKIEPVSKKTINALTEAIDELLTIDIALTQQSFADAATRAQLLAAVALDNGWVWIELRARVSNVAALLNLDQIDSAILEFQGLLGTNKFVEFQQSFLIDNPRYVKFLQCFEQSEVAKTTPSTSSSKRKWHQLKVTLALKSFPDFPELSPREIEILKLVAKGFADKEVAATLSIGLGTVKTHLRNSYRKLEVSKRTQAVKKAQNLALL